MRRPRGGKYHKRVVIHTSIDEELKLTLKMLGFNISALVEELLTNIAGSKKCPTCGREVKPLITGRKVDYETL